MTSIDSTAAAGRQKRAHCRTCSQPPGPCERGHPGSVHSPGCRPLSHRVCCGIDWSRASLIPFRSKSINTLTFAFRCILREESVRQACPHRRPRQHIAIVALVLDARTDVHTGRQQARVGRPFGFATRQRSMLADKVEISIAAGVRPQPSLGAIEARAIITSGGHIPEADRHVLAIDPFPVGRILRVAYRTEPVLSIGIVPVTSVELPGEETLQRRRCLVHQGATLQLAMSSSGLEVGGLVVVEDVALAIVGRCRAQWLVAERWTLLDGEGCDRNGKTQSSK